MSESREFDLLDDLTISPGNYGGPSAYFGASSSRRRSLSGSFTYSWADGFYGGNRQSLNLGINKNFGAHVRINFGGQAQH